MGSWKRRRSGRTAYGKAIRVRALGSALLCLAFAACQESAPPAGTPAYDLAGGCYAVAAEDGSYLSAAGGTFDFRAGSLADAAAFRLRASDLGDYLLYDASGHFAAAKPGGSGAEAGRYRLLRTARRSDIRIPPHQHASDAEWAIGTRTAGGDRYLVRHLNSGLYLTPGGLGERPAGNLRMVAHTGCIPYPELPLEASGTVRREPWPDGQVYGAADAHSHLMTNLGFGGGGIFHGAPFHRLGVEFALADCAAVHGKGGRRDIVGSFLGGGGDINVEEIAQVFAEGRVEGFNHATAGYPEFASWPDARNNPTHQQQYYRWLERAYMGGLRLIVQLATGNSALCELLVGLGAQEAPYGCNDMDSVDRTLEQTRALERYIDAQHGGPGKGWFRVVETPEQAREVINDGKLAVVLGIEISNLFDCFLTPPPGVPPCDLDQVRAQVAEYHDKGVRVVFPVHKYDNGFSAGDGDRGAIELGNVINSGQFSSFTLDCPDITHNFDSGDVQFGGLNLPRSDYDARPPMDISELRERPVQTLLPIVPGLAGGALEGPYCQRHGLTPLGEDLLGELMDYGMVIDIAHLPKRSTVQALEILDAARYPAISTHGQAYDGDIYRHGGTSNAGFGTCADPANPGGLADRFLERAAAVKAANGLPAQPLSFDYNGFAGSRAPRFGAASPCTRPQANPITYPFRSYGGGVTFVQPTLGNRTVDFNTEGKLHIGLLPELIEDVRNDGVSDAELEPLFRTAEAFLQTWERSLAAAE